MQKKDVIRETKSGELPQILDLYPLAFPDEELRPLVTRLIEGAAETISLGSYRSDILTGHVIFTVFSGVGDNDDGAGALLAPLGVLPDYHNQGIGSALVMDGLERLAARGTRQVFVLGDPNYYGRFGFRQETHVLPPYPMPEEWAAAWQSKKLSQAAPLRAGQCQLPDEWMDRKLWLP